MACEHAQGITDVAFTHNEHEIVTCSSDRTARVHRIDYENKTLEHKTVLNISDFDTNGYADNIDKQQLGVLFSDVDKELMTVNLHSDINVWPLTSDAVKPAKTIRGHSNAIKAMTIFDGKIPITGDNDGRILSWDIKTAQANRPIGLYKHKIGITALACNSKFVYSASGDMAVMVYELKEEKELQSGLSLCSVLPDFVKKNSSVANFIATDEVLYAFYLDKSIQALKADNIEECLKDSGKLEELGEAKGEATCFALCAERGEMIIGDSKGFAHIFDATSLAPKADAPIKTAYGHPCVSVAVSPDGKKFAVGDTKGYATVYDMETRAQICYIYGHKSKVLQCAFTPDSEWVSSFAFDQSLSLGLISNPAGSRLLQRPSGYAVAVCVSLMQDEGNNLILSAGYDCAVRIWKY